MKAKLLDHEKFTKNIYILSSILKFKPQSVYELAKTTGVDVSHLNKIIIFYEELCAVKIKKKKKNSLFYQLQKHIS
jgi:predicted transcriptional regulator